MKRKFEQKCKNTDQFVTTRRQELQNGHSKCMRRSETDKTTAKIEKSTTR